MKKLFELAELISGQLLYTLTKEWEQTLTFLFEVDKNKPRQLILGIHNFSYSAFNYGIIVFETTCT